MPLVAAGLRTTTVQVVATATLAAFVGGGGLGRYIVDGFGQQDTVLITCGVILVAAALRVHGGRDGARAARRDSRRRCASRSASRHVRSAERRRHRSQPRHERADVTLNAVGRLSGSWWGRAHDAITAREKRRHRRPAGLRRPGAGRLRLVELRADATSPSGPTGEGRHHRRRLRLRREQDPGQPLRRRAHQGRLHGHGQGAHQPRGRRAGAREGRDPGRAGVPRHPHRVPQRQGQRRQPAAQGRPATSTRPSPRSRRWPRRSGITRAHARRPRPTRTRSP